MQSGSDLEPRRIPLGGCCATVLSAGALSLDGGAMFGIIPKPLWGKQVAADERNRIRLACNSVLLDFDDGRRMLIEAGHGAKFGDKEIEIYQLDTPGWVEPSLKRLGVDVASISDVVVTHLHFDHAGGLTRWAGPEAAPQQTFPRARVHVQQQELHDARANFGVMKTTYRSENLAPLDEADVWRTVEGEHEISPSVHVLPLPGHTRGHQGVVVRGSERTLCFPGDVLPTAAHLGDAYNMGYDLFPLDNQTSKRQLLTRAAEEDWLLVLGHEVTTPVVTVQVDGRWFGLTGV